MPLAHVMKAEIFMTSMKQSGIEWLLGVGAIVLTWEGIIAFWLGCVVTVLTIYKIFLDIQIRRTMLRSKALSQISKNVSSRLPDQKQHEESKTNPLVDAIIEE